MTSGADQALAVELTAFDTATLYEAAGQRGAFPAGMVAMSSDDRVAGPALTVLTYPGDNLAIHRAVAASRPGEVIVAQCHDSRCGVWGEVLTAAAIARGVTALVVDGAVRDLDAIRELGFPVFAKTTSIRAATKDREGHLGIPITCGGQLVCPGDYVVADVSGLVVIPADEVGDVLTAARRRADKETGIMHSLRGGSTTVELLGLDGRRSEGRQQGDSR